jgi:hypothetical protein
VITPLACFTDPRTRGNDTSIVCLAPANAGSARWFDVVVVVGNVPSTFLSDQWQYLPPEVAAVSPSSLAPHPMNTTLTVVGTGFGNVPGGVTIGNATVMCSLWTRVRILCTAPAGVLASTAVVVTRPGGQRSNAASPAAAVSYRAPAVQSLSLRSVGTRGGAPLTVVGSDFATPLPVTVWLLPAGAEPGETAPWLIPGAKQCPVVATGSVISELSDSDSDSDSDSVGDSSGIDSGSGRGGDSDSDSDSDSDGDGSGIDSGSGRGGRGGDVGNARFPLILHTVTCTAPSGVGVNWAVAIVNHGTPVEDAMANASLSQWQVSGRAANATVDYLPPSVTTVSVVTAATWQATVALTDEGADLLPAPPRPRVGGFLVLVRGSNLGGTPPMVLVSGGRCEPLPEAGAASHEHVVCTAPAMSLGVPNVVDVIQAGQRSTPVVFLYDPPVVDSVQPGVVDAVGRCVSGVVCCGGCGGWRGVHSFHERMCGCYTTGDRLISLFGLFCSVWPAERRVVWSDPFSPWWAPVLELLPPLPSPAGRFTSSALVMLPVSTSNGCQTALCDARC